jgi:hypothetical protein
MTMAATTMSQNMMNGNCPGMRIIIGAVRANTMTKTPTALATAYRDPSMYKIPPSNTKLIAAAGTSRAIDT